MSPEYYYGDSDDFVECDFCGGTDLVEEHIDGVDCLICIDCSGVDFER